MPKIETALLILLLLLAGVIAGYTWHIVQTAQAYTPPSHTVASDEIIAAMDRMGPLYDYRMIGETLYVDTGDGWQRLQYREGK